MVLSRQYRSFALILALLLGPIVFLTGCGEDSSDVEGDLPVDSTAGGTVDADFSIDRGIGPVHLYTMTLTMEQSAEYGGEAMQSTMRSDGTFRMRKVDSSNKGVTWVAVMDMAMKGETGGSPIPTMNQTQRLRYLVDRDRNVVSVAMRSEDAGMDESVQQVLQEVSERHNASQFFLKEEWKGRQVGESWEETITDTIDLDSVAFMGTAVMGDLDLRFMIRTRYTYRGEVDTLGMRMIRIDTETLAMEIDGTVRAEEMAMLMASSGSGSGTQYFDPATDLYTVGIATQQMTTTIAMPSMQMEIPMTQKMILTSVRGDLAPQTEKKSGDLR